MPKVEINTLTSGIDGFYSAGVEIDGWLFISGQDTGPATGAVSADRMKKKPRLTLNHIGKVLQSAGYSFADVVSALHLKTFDGRFDKVY